jgi:hypothetical protein
MSGDYQKFGDSDHKIQLILAAVEISQGMTLESISAQYDIDVAFAVVATALGRLGGEVQAKYDAHRGECETCDAKNLHVHELFLKNFNASFAQAKREREQNFAEAVGEANEALERIFKRKHK